MKELNKYGFFLISKKKSIKNKLLSNFERISHKNKLFLPTFKHSNKYGCLPNFETISN